jgi:hypothetical protein
MGKRKLTSRQPATTTLAPSKKPRSNYEPSMCDKIIALGKKGRWPRTSTTSLLIN